MSAVEFDRIIAFEHRFEQAQAADVVDLDFGAALLQPEFSLSMFHNRIVVTAPVTAGDLLAAADAVLGGRGLGHRYVSVDDDALGKKLSATFVAQGYAHETIAAMVYSGPPVTTVRHDVRSVSFDAVRPTLVRDWLVSLPDATDEELRQLVDRTVLYERGAELSRLAVFDDAEIAAHANLYIDPVDGIAQFENLVTHPRFRGRGYGRALVDSALLRGWEAGCDLLVLTADVNDWPYQWYQRLGYVDVGHTHHFHRRGV